jgi:hypothetical protein
MQNKSKKLTSRLLSALLALACVLTLLPGVAVAAEDEGGKMVVDKTAKLEDDGTYTIELSAYATGTTTTTTTQKAVPCDIVLVLDQSSSMGKTFGRTTRLAALKTAANNFIQNVQKDAATNNVDHRVAVVGFASTRERHGGVWSGYYAYDNTEILSTNSVVNYEDAESTDYQNALVSVNTNGSVNSRLTTAINRLDAEGDTYSEYGIDMANKIFTANPIDADSDRVRIVIMFTDGYTAPANTDDIDYSMSDRAIKNAYSSKATYGATVYTVGIFTGADPTADIERNFTYGSTNTARQLVAANRYMHYVSSNYPEARDLRNGGTEKADTYYLSASDTDQLNSIFTKISESVVTPSTTVTLDEKSVMRDILNGGFVIPSSGCTVKTETRAGTMNDDGTITWGQVTNDEPGPKYTVNDPSGVINVTGFNYSEQYIAEGHPGQKLTVTIQGVEARDEAITNAPISTNTALSGIYETSEAETPAFTFPQPTTILKSKTYVLDYGKPVNLASQDWGIGSVTTLNGAGMYKFDPEAPTVSLTKTYGKVATATAKMGLTYTPTTMNWNGYDSFYVFGKQIAPNGAINQWSKVTVMPANSVYYEDTFVTDENAGTVGIVYGGEWTTDGTDANRGQTLDSDHPYGWETGYAGDTGYSDGSAHKAVASAENKATASFTFTGTGVDVYSRTDLTTGTVAATLTKKDENGKEVGVKSLVVDNLAASAGENGAYYQIPTLFFDGLDYGEYTLTLYVTTAAENRATYYLDGVRVYNPIQPKEEDAVVKEAYGTAGELGASFQSVREILLTAEDFDPTTNNTTDGVVFIDQDGTTTGTTTQVIGIYKDYGPKNEVYLAKGQSIAFKVSDLTANYYLGIKAPNGKTTAKVTWEESVAALPVNAASDLYYQVTPNADGYILVKNTGENLLSVTKLRTTNGNEQAGITTANVDDLLAYANTFDTLEEITYSTQPGEVEIENPEVNELGDGSIVRDWLEKIFKGIRDLLRP